MRPRAALPLLLALAAAPAAAQPSRYHLVIRGARILDGTGNPAYPADVGAAMDGSRESVTSPAPAPTGSSRRRA